MTRLLITLSAFLICLLMSLVGIAWAPRLHLMDVPGGRRQHGAPVPRVGGLAIFGTILLIIFMRSHLGPLMLIEMLGLTGMALLGLADDVLDLRAKWKAGGGLALALVLAAAEIWLHPMAAAHIPFLGLQVSPYRPLFFLALAFMYWCLPHAFNLIDGANGLAVGVALEVVGSLWIRGWPNPLMVGALLACLALNWPKARLFLGDCGSLSLGLFLGMFAQKALLFHQPESLLWLFAYPTADVLMVTAIRMLTGEPIFRGDRNHLHHQIQDRWPHLAGLTAPGLVLVAGLVSSRIYLPEAWLAVPICGLAALLGLVLYLAVQSLREHRTGAAFGPLRAGAQRVALAEDLSVKRLG